MLLIGGKIAVDGLDSERQTFLKKDSETIENMNFYNYNQNLLESPKDFQLSPIFFTSEARFISYTYFTILPGYRYNIFGNSGIKDGEVFLSIYDGEIKLSDYLYSTKISNNSFDFNFDNELNKEEETTVIIWTQSYNLSSLLSFTATLKLLDFSKDTQLVFLGEAPPEEPDGGTSLDTLIVKGTVQNIGPQLNGVFIYEEDFLRTNGYNDVLTIQKKITNGFEKLENNLEFTEDEYNDFYQALMLRTETTMQITSSEYKIEIVQREEEKDWRPVSYFYLWSILPSDVDKSLESIITIGLTEEGEKDISWTECLSGDTLIIMADGSKKRLDQLQPGELVQDINGKSTKVNKVDRGTYHPYHTLYFFEGDIVIDEISSHRFFNVEKGFWEHLKKWKIGEHALDINGEKRALLYKKRIYERKENFGLDTESGRYFANDLLSGPARCNQTLLKNSSLKKAVEMVGSIKSFQSFKLINSKEIL